MKTTWRYDAELGRVCGRSLKAPLFLPQVSSINADLQPPHGSSAKQVEQDLLPTPGTDRPVLEDNLFLPSGQNRGLSASSSSLSAEIFQELQQECMRRLKVPSGGVPVLVPPSPLQPWGGPQDRPLIPPRVPLPPRPAKRAEYPAEYPAARRSRDLSPTPADPLEDAGQQHHPPRVPPREPLSQPGSRTPSPRGLAAPLSTHGCYLSTSPGKLAAKVSQAQGEEAPSRGPCILPILQDGRKVSSTHYYLLPERPPYLDRCDRFFREAEKLPANTAAVRPMVLAQPAELRANFSSNNNSGLGGPRPGTKASASLPRVRPDGLTAPAGTDGGTDAGLSSAARVKMVGSESRLLSLT